MTAIAGLCGGRPSSFLEHQCFAALAAQRLYGRRGARVFSSAEIALGIDIFDTLPEDRFDRQPIGNADYTMVADVRLDNRKDLLRELGVVHSPRAPKSDSDILFLAWQRWQEACLDRLDGDFAFGIFDHSTQCLTLVRDRTGNRPLCYGVRNRTLHFASMPSGVFPDLPLKPDLMALAIRLTDPPLSGGWTAFEDVRILLPGQLLRYSATGLETKAYWNPCFGGRATGDAAGLVEQFRHHLDNAVSRRMRRNGSVIAAQLSAGYDSSAVTGTAARLCKPHDRLVAFTSAPSPGAALLQLRGRIADESPVSAATAEFLGIEHFVIRDQSPLLASVAGHSRFYQEPVANILNLGWSNAIADASSTIGANVMLSAGLGNFTISYGGLPVLTHWIRSGKWLRWMREANAAVATNDVRWRGVMMASFDPWIAPWMSHMLERAFRRAPAATEHGFVRRDFAETVSTTHPARPRSTMSGSLPADRLSLIRDFDFGFHYKGQLAQSGIDERDPTSDRRLIEFCLGLSPDNLLHRGAFRPLAKAALADRVLPQVLDSRVRGYQCADWFDRLTQRDAFAMLEEISGSNAGDLLDLPKLRSAIEDWPSMTNDNAVSLTYFGRGLTNALATGLFVSEVERNGSSIGR